MTRLSVNINKVALLRNARGGNMPDLIQVAKDCEQFGAQGITVHPRPDQRHIRYSDIPALKQVVQTEFNIEGNPTPDFIRLMEENLPHQCTLVPDAPDQLTSSFGWDTIKHRDFLKDVCSHLSALGIRVSLFVDPIAGMLEGAVACGAHRVELYTGPYAEAFEHDQAMAVSAYTKAAELAGELGLGLNAGHDLNLNNLQYFKSHCPGLAEVSIGHALISDALYFGLSATIKMYLQQLS
ncbi:MAG: pyridoxine 5'-phosphate synthase [Bacteroidetes bacterium]|nr:pyridoxine 5'-phosphate synthase [Bacteroidota bacterium]